MDIGKGNGFVSVDHWYLTLWLIGGNLGADCGYIYDRDIDGNGKYFEEQKKGFICPQCSAPRKRYAKKVGDSWVSQFRWSNLSC